MFLCTLSHFIISPLIGSRDINSRMYPSRDWFTCFTYKVNAASRDPRGGIVLLFPPSTLDSDNKNWQTLTADFCLTLIYIAYILVSLENDILKDMRYLLMQIKINFQACHFYQCAPLRAAAAVFDPAGPTASYKTTMTQKQGPHNLH